MSLPVQGGDAVTVARIIWYLVDSWNNVPNEFQALCREVTILQAEHRQLEDLRRKQQHYWSDDTLKHYEVLSEHTRKFLIEFRKIFIKYKSLRENKKTPKRLLFRITHRASDLRAQINLQLTAVISFKNGLLGDRNESISADMAEIKQHLEQLRNCNTEGEMYSELRKNDIPEDFIKSNKDVIYSSFVQVVRFHEQNTLPQPLPFAADAVLEGTEARHSSLADDENDAEIKETEAIDPEELDRLIDEATPALADLDDSTIASDEQFWPPLADMIDLVQPNSRTASVMGSETSEEARMRKASLVAMIGKALQDVGNSSQAHDGVAGPPSPDLRKARAMSYAESVTPTLVEPEQNDLTRKDTSKSISASSTRTQSTKSSTSPSMSKKKTKGIFGSLARVGTSSLAH